jgi:hypothetical protein
MKIIIVLDKTDLVGIQKFQRQLNLPVPSFPEKSTMDSLDFRLVYYYAFFEVNMILFLFFS